MNFREISEEEKKEHAELMFQRLSSADELHDWILAYLGLDLPMGVVDPDSNVGPIDAMREIYDNVLNNRGDVTPGYIMLSARECYKCQIKGSKLLTPNGLKNIEDAKIGDEVWTGFSWQKIKNHIHDGEKDGIRVIVDGGIELVGSPIHRYWALRDGIEQWIKSSDLNSETDLICLNSDNGIKNLKDIDQDEYSIGYFLGLLAGDGSVSAIESKTHNHYALTTIDPYIKEFFYSFVKQRWNSKIHITSDKITYCIWDKKSIQNLKEWGVDDSRSWEKTIPKSCYENLSRMKGFIAGLFDTDGSFTKKGSAIISITSLELLKEVQLSLLSFGIVSNLRSNKKLYSNQKHLVHSLAIGQFESKKFPLVGIDFKAKKANIPKLPDVFDTQNGLPKTQIQWFLDVVCKYGYVQIRNRKFLKRGLGNYETVSIGRIEHLCDWMEENNEHGKVSAEDVLVVKKMRSLLSNTWRKFSLEQVKNADFYDLTVENDHSYWSNGSISHNTLGASILETLLMLHFEITIAHMSAIQSQSGKAIQYINYFFNKLEPLLEVSNWTKTSENKGKISYRTSKGEDVYIRVIICTVGGANSEHTSLMFVDEIDVVQNPQAYEEAKLIPGYSKGIFPLTIKLSTRKYAFGLMQKELDNADASGDKILRWNTLDVTERCPEKRHRPDLPKQDVYVNKSLPLKTIMPDEYEEMPDAEKKKWEGLKGVHGGCVSCKLLPVCKTRLANRSETAVGGLYKPISTVINNFKKTSPDMGEAQLLCWRPSSKGLVYPRFENVIDKGNVLSLEKAWEIITGEKSKKSKVTDIDVLWLLKNHNIPMYAGVDWGYTHDFVIVIFAKIPNGQIWIVDCYSVAGLEFADCLEAAKSFRDKYPIEKWYCDQAMPSHIKSFTKNQMKSPAFTKDVMGGIEALRSKIIDGSGVRWLQVLNTDNNKKVISSFQKHHFKLDSIGNPTLVPDDDPGVSDQADAMRYVGQNLFPVKGTQKIEAAWTGPDGKPIDGNTPEGKEELRKRLEHANQMREEIYKRVDGSAPVGITGKKGGFHFNV